jgi:hypothetical protein
MDFTKIPFDKLQLYFEPDIVVNNRSILRYCDDCKLDMIIDDYLYVCRECGNIDDTPIYDAKYELDYYPKPISVLKTSKTKKYIKVKEYFENLKDDFNDINSFYFLMKAHGYSKYYPNIYGLWYDIKKYRLITLTYKQIDILVNEFVKIDILFKSNSNGRSNMISYNSTLYYLFKKLKIKGCSEILLPYNYKRMLQRLKVLNK